MPSDRTQTCAGCGASIEPLPSKPGVSAFKEDPDDGEETGLRVDHYRCECGKGGTVVRTLDGEVITTRGPAVDPTHSEHRPPVRRAGKQPREGLA